jgi:osmotically-inducible protein OsmY
MIRRIPVYGLALLLGLLMACSSAPDKKSKSDFLQKMERESEEFARRKMKERAEQEAKRKQQWEEYRKRMEEEAARAQQPAAAPAPQSPAEPAADVQYVLSDKDLTFLVLNKIRLITRKSSVSVECKDGVVKLFGEAESAEVKQKIIAELKKLPGVVKVDGSELYPAAK